MVQFHGIGQGPDESSRHLGCVSQLGLFIRKDVLNNETELTVKPESVSLDPVELEKLEENYKLVIAIDYPFFHDGRTRDEIILDEAEYHLNRLKHVDDNYYDYTTRKYLIPLKTLSACTYKVTENIEEIRAILKNKYEMTEEHVILESDVEPDSDSDY